GYVKGAGSEISRAAPAHSSYSHWPGICEPLAARFVRASKARPGPAPRQMVGDAEGHVVRPHIGLERAAADQVGIVCGKAQLIVAEHRKPGAEMVFYPDQALHGHAVKLIVEGARIGRARRSANLDMREGRADA